MLIWIKSFLFFFPLSFYFNLQLFRWLTAHFSPLKWDIKAPCAGFLHHFRHVVACGTSLFRNQRFFIVARNYICCHFSFHSEFSFIFISLRHPNYDFFFFFTCLRILMQRLIVTEQCHLQRRMPPIIKETPKWTILGNCLFKKNKSEIRESVILSGTSHWTPLFTFLMFSYFIASGYQSIYCQQLGTVGVAVFVILMIFYRKMQ